MQPQGPVSAFKRALFGGWLSRALFISGFVCVFMVSVSFAIDYYFQSVFQKKTVSSPAAKQVFNQFPAPTNVITQPVITGITATQTQIETATITPKASTTPNPTSTPRIIQATPSPSSLHTATPTSQAQPTHAPTNTPATNTSTPTQVVASGCFVRVSGYLYNMQSAVSSTVVDQNTGKTRVHTTSDFQCGTQASPTDVTAIYLAKHSTMGCWQRIAPYIVTPPAPTDPTCE